MNRFLRARCRQWQKGEPEFLAVGLLDGVAGKAGIVEEGMAVGSENVTDALERTAKTDLLVITHYLYICTLVETEDDAAALLLDEFLTTTAADVTELFWGSRQSELTGYLYYSELVQSGTLRHFLIGQIGVFHLHEGTCITVAASRIVLAETELAGMLGNRAKREAKMGGYIVEILCLKAFLKYVVMLWCPEYSFCLRLEGCIHSVQFIFLVLNRFYYLFCLSCSKQAAAVGDEPSKIILVGIYERPGKGCDDGGDAMAAIDRLKGGHYIVG